MLVALLFCIAQLVLVPHPFGFSTDEATYLAKVDPAVPELYWSPPRAWGVPVLAAPVAYLSAGLSVTRLYFTALSSLGLAAGFWPWLRVLHPAVAPLAALLFSTTWVTLFFGPQVMPNLYVALGAVAVVGLLLRAAQERDRWPVLLVVATALLALVRPTDSVLVLAPLVVVALLVPRLRRMRSLAAVVAGEVLGWLPWVVEAFVRFGGPVARLRQAESAGPHGVDLGLTGLLTFPRLLDGVPLYCCDGGPATEAGPVPLLPTSWLLTAVVLALLGLLLAVRQHQVPEILIPGLAGGLLAAFYLLLPSFIALRFLLPAFALLAIPVAAALTSSVVATQGRRRQVVTVLVCAAVVIHVVGMLATATKVFDDYAAGRNTSLAISAALRPVIGGRPCLVVGVEAQTTAYYLGCEVAGASSAPRPPQRVLNAQTQGRFTLAVLRKPPRSRSFLASWTPVEVPGLPRGFEAYVAPA